MRADAQLLGINAAFLVAMDPTLLSLEPFMPANLEISKEVFDQLMNESIGVADISDDKVVGQVPVTYRINCFTTPAIHTSGTR